MQVPYCFDNVALENMKLDIVRLHDLFLFRIVLAILSLLRPHVNFWMDFSISAGEKGI